MTNIPLTEEHALVLQLVDENDQEDFEFLAEALRFNKQRLNHILQGLQQKKLIRMTQDGPYSWVSLSSRGRRLIGTLWPESKLHNN